MQGHLEDFPGSLKGFLTRNCYRPGPKVMPGPLSPKLLLLLLLERILHNLDTRTSQELQTKNHLQDLDARASWRGPYQDLNKIF